ncbi:MAG: HD domain-containing protein [Candidatus Sulfotelmatobacter sp.]
MSRPLWPRLPSSLGYASVELQKVFATDLESYIQTNRNRPNPRGFKVINDPIWFTIRVESWELVVLDSPIIQRLRDVRQLGLASLVYPSAGYSRFEHTIGVLYQTQRIIESINRNARAYSARTQRVLPEPISRLDEAQLRLSAVLHDIGHCFLSHVSERELVKLQVAENVSMTMVRKDAQQFFNCSRPPSVGEVLSALIVLLPEFIELLEVAKIPSWTGKEQDLAFSIAQLIVRGRFPDRPFMNDIISGAVDADKLDYMSRDCYMAGLAMPIDVERLLEKLCVVNVPVEQLPDPEYQTKYKLLPEQTVQVLAVQQGGAKVFEDLVLSRVLLYDKLYYHQKVRAMEGAVVNVLDILREHHPSFRQLSTYVQLSEAQFMEGRWPEAPKKAKKEVEQALHTLRQVKQRSFVRAFAFGPELITDPEVDGTNPNGEKLLRKAWGELSPLVSREVTNDATAFRTRIRKRAQDYLRVVGQPGIADELTDFSIVVDLPDIQGIAKKTKAFVGDEGSGVRLFNELFRVEKWAEAYENQKITGYVFCPAEAAVAVHVACRDIIRESFSLGFEPWSWTLTKIRVEDLDSFTQTLKGRGVQTSPVPIPEWLRSRKTYLNSRQAKTIVLQPSGAELDQLGEKFANFQSYDNQKITRKRIEEWLLQFESDEIPLALTALRNVRYWDRASIVDAFAVALSDWGNELLNEQWVPLGGPTTSSHHLNYLWPDLKKRSNAPKRILGGAEELESAETVVFYDDNVGSAGQSKTVLQQWFGLPRSAWYVDEEHVQTLPKNKLQIIKKATLKFLFVTGRRKGLEALLSMARDLCGHSRVEGHIIAPADLSCFQPAAGVFADTVTAQKAREAFVRAGRRALADKRELWKQEKLEGRLLGYGNFGGLTVFYYNVPTATVTALWKSSPVSSSEWLGLFPRRPRD